MLFKPTLFITSILLLCGSALEASSGVVLVANTTAGSRQFASFSGSLLPDGDLVRIGFFNTSGANLTTLQTSNVYATVNALFTPLGEGIANAGTESGAGQTAGTALQINSSGGAGNILAQYTGISTSYPAAVPGTLLYAWVFNTTYTNRANATQWGIFQAPTGTSNWIAAPDTSSATLNTNQSSFSAIRGTVTSSQAQLANVPEPSTYALLGTGLLTTFTLLRRRKMA
jgi:hypothetical protein